MYRQKSRTLNPLLRLRFLTASAAVGSCTENSPSAKPAILRIEPGPLTFIIEPETSSASKSAFCSFSQSCWAEIFSILGRRKIPGRRFEAKHIFSASSEPNSSSHFSTSHLGKGDSGQIFATDIDSQRLKKVAANCERLGISSVKTIPYEEISSTGAFDVILLDVPCSNTGVLARRPQVRHRITPQAIKHLANMQLEIINRAVRFLKPAGRICYSTCSICQQECSELLRRFIGENPDFTVESERLILPSAGREQGHSCDGGFSAIVSRK